MDVFTTVIGVIITIVVLGVALLLTFFFGPRNKGDRWLFLIIQLAYWVLLFIIGRSNPEALATFKNILMVFGIPIFIIFFAYMVWRREIRIQKGAELAGTIRNTLLEFETLSQEIITQGLRDIKKAESPNEIKAMTTSIKTNLISIEKELISL